jgi:hypothetical protein
MSIFQSDVLRDRVFKTPRDAADAYTLAAEHAVMLL